ncbi:MAG: hypothetical protein JZU65_08915, partial [Chlorobium sp.]|nr:hypothetical protein [Chlorobium sp.]
MKAVLLFRHLAIQPSSLVFGLRDELFCLPSLTPLLVIPTLGRDLIGIPGNGTKRGSCPRIDANLREKEIGSWFSQASPIKTTAGF